MAQLQNYYNTGENDQADFSDTLWKAQTFTVGDAYTINRVRVKIYRLGSPGTITVSIRATTEGVPSGADLTSGTTSGNTLTDSDAGEWRSISLTDYELSASTAYAIVIRGGVDASNKGYWKNDSTATGGMYQSANSGSTWSGLGVTSTFIFETYSPVDYTETFAVGAFALTFLTAIFGRVYSIALSVLEFTQTLFDVTFKQGGTRWTSQDKNSDISATNSNKNSISPTNSDKTATTFTNSDRS